MPNAAGIARRHGGGIDHMQKVRPRMVAVLGMSGVGKTVYLGMLLDMLSRRPERMQFFGAAFRHGPQTVVGSLARGPVSRQDAGPAGSAGIRSIANFAGAPGRGQIELIVPDMAGEAMSEEVDDPHTHPASGDSCRNAPRVLLVDAAEMDDGSPDQDYFAMKLLSYLNELRDDGEPAWPSRPLAVVLSKADRCENCFEDPADFAHKGVSGLWRHCVERFPRHRFFASGVAGRRRRSTFAAAGESSCRSHRAAGNHRAVRMVGATD